jgi:hypothetical protein
MKEDYIRSLHYCPMCGTVVGCGEGHCDSEEFRNHIANCRLASRGKSGKLRYNEGEGV